MADFGTKPEEKRRKKKRKLRESEDDGRGDTFRIHSREAEKKPEEEEEAKDEQRGTNQKYKQGGPWKNLDLILSIQSKELDLQRKIELAFEFVHSKTNKEGDGNNQGFETVSISRLIVFLHDWIQSLICSDKTTVVEGKKPRSGVMEVYLDFRCWVVFKFCLEEASNLQVTLSLSPNLLRAISCIARDALSTVDNVSQHGKELDVMGEGYEFYTVVSDCVSLLFSSHGRVFNANADLWVSMVSSVLDLVHKIYSNGLACGNMVPLLRRFAGLVLEPFIIFLRIHPSPKNVFPIFVDRLLEQLIGLLVVLYLQTDDINSKFMGNLLKMVEDILSNGLFHPTHVGGFLNTHSTEKYVGSHDRKTKDKKMVIKSYHRHFFQKLKHIMAEKKLALGGVGELFRLFVIRVKKQKGVLVLPEGAKMMAKTVISRQVEGDNTGSMSKVSAGNNNTVPEKIYSSSRLDMETCKSLFDLFVQFMEPLVLDLKSYPETNLDVGPMLLNTHCTLKCMNKILASFMHEKIFVRTEDTSEGARLNFLKEVYDTVISFAAKIHLLWLSELNFGKGLHMEMLSLIAKELIISVWYFLEIEYEVVGDDLISLWLMMLSFSAIELSLMDSPDQSMLTSETLHLGCQMVNIYSELRQVSIPIFALSKAVRLFGFCDNDGEMNYSRFVSTPSLPSEACVKSVTKLLCSQDFRLAISNSIKSIPEGQASGCIRQLKTDISETLKWMKVNCLRASGTEFEECSMLALNLQAELLGRGLSEVYTLVLDSSTVTMGNSILVGNSVRDLMTKIHLTLGCLVKEQPESVSKFLFSDECKIDLPSVGAIASWVFMFFFRLYISCRSLNRQSISLMPPDSSRETSTAMGDLFTAYSGKDWIERTDWRDEGYFSWIFKPTASLLTIIKSVSENCLQGGVVGCPPLIYVLHAMAFQRIVDLNRQIKAFEFQEERVIWLVQMKLMDDAGLPLSNGNKKWIRRISVLRQEAAELTSFMMGYLPLIAKQVSSVSTSDYVTFDGKGAWASHEDDAWDLCVSSVNEKSLPTSLWWILCQNTDIWCPHASKKELKKFLSLLLCNFLSCVRSSLGDARKQNRDGRGHLRKVTVHQISLELLSDTLLYEQTFLRRHLTSRFCRNLEKSMLPLFRDSFSKVVDFNSLPNWPEVLGILEDTPVVVLNSTQGDYPVTGQYSIPSNLLPVECQKEPKACPSIGMELMTCQSFLNLLCWMPKGYLNLRSFSKYATYIINLERLVVSSLLDFHLCLHYHPELLRLFVSCRRALKYLLMAACEEKVEVGQSSLIPILFESSFSFIWLLKSVYAVVGLPIAVSEERVSQVKDMAFSLMDHTSYVFLTLSKDNFRLAVHSLIYDEKLPIGLLDSGVLSEQDNLVESDTSFDSSERCKAWKGVVLMAKTLREQTESSLDSLKITLCNADLEAGVSVVDLNKLSATISCFQGFLWGLVSALDNINEKHSTMETKSLIRKLGHIFELNRCINVFEDFINFCLHLLLLENGRQTASLCGSQCLSGLDCNNGSLSLVETYRSSVKFSGDETVNPDKEQESITDGRDESTLDTDDGHEKARSSADNCVRSSRFQKKRSQLEDFGCAVNLLTEVDLLELHHLKKPLMRSLLKGENPEVAFSLRQLFIASSAILGLKLQINCSPSSSNLMPTFVGISQFLLLEFAEMVEMPHSFSFVWFDGILKYLEVLGSHFSLTNPTSSRNAYAKLIDLHLRAIGKCISLQGKGATLASHETESSTKTLLGQIGSFESSLCHGPYSLDEFKARLRKSFKVFIRKPLELHLLSAIQALERALVGVQEGCNMVYEINTGSPDGGKVSSIVAAGVDCLDLILESVSGRKRLNVVKRHIQSLIGALFNIVVHLQGPLIFYGRLTCNKEDTYPDPGSVILMCVQVLTKVAGKHSLFQMDSCHVGQSLHIPATLFKDFHQLKASQPTPNSLMISAKQDSGSVIGKNSYTVDQQFSVELFAASCRLLCTVLRHHKSETERCIALLQDSVSALLYCLETVDTDFVVRKGYFAWKLQEGVKCASFLRRIYEEIRQQKDVLGQHCFQFLSNYIWIYSGYGPLRTGIIREIDEALRPGVYALVDACSPDDLQQLHTVLGEGPCRSTLATLQHDYKLNFQYEGKV